MKLFPCKHVHGTLQHTFDKLGSALLQLLILMLLVFLPKCLFGFFLEGFIFFEGSFASSILDSGLQWTPIFTMSHCCDVF